MSTSQSRTPVFLPRLVLGTLLVSTTFLPWLYQPILKSIYSFLYHSRFYQLSTFETIETVFCYALIEPLFTYKFGHNPHLRIDQREDFNYKKSDEPRKPKLPKMLRPSQRLGEILIYIAPLLSMDLTMIKKFAGVPVADIRVSGNYPPFEQDFQSLYSSSTAPKDNISPFFLLPTFHNFTISSPFQTTRALPPAVPTTRRLALELIFAFIIYDFLFFLLHLGVHRIPLLRNFHLKHHAHMEIHPQVTNRLSIPERLSLVLLANFSLNIIGSHVLTRTLFVPVFVYMLVEIHSGLNLPWGYEKILPQGWGLGAKEHALHHRSGENGAGGYAPFFTWCDRLLNHIEGNIGSTVR